MALPCYEDAPPDLLAGRMDLEVILPEGIQQKINVPRSTAMMDLRVQLTTSRRLSPTAFSLQPLGPAGEPLPFQPSTPVGALDVWSVRLIPKTRSIVPVKRAAPRPIPVAPVPASGTPGAPASSAFQQTFRLQVHLPRNQLFVTRASSRVLLGDVLQLACEEKNLDPAKYELRHPANLDERLSAESTLGECNLTEVALVPCGNRQPDTSALLRQEARRREAAHRGTAQPHFPYVVPHTVGAEGSVSSMSSGGRSASPAPSDGSSVERCTSPPPPRPGRKRRPAPKPPGPPATELNNNVCKKEFEVAPVISHSRNSSDSSGYHEASVLSESPEGGTSCGGSGTDSLGSLAPRGKLEVSQSMTNLSMAQLETLKGSASTSALFPSDGGKGTPGRKRLYKMWSYLLGGQRKKKAPPPPPSMNRSSISSASSAAGTSGESFLKTQSLERRESLARSLPAMGAAHRSPPAEDVALTLPPLPPAQQHTRVDSSSGSQTPTPTPTPTPSEGDSCMLPELPEDPVDCTSLDPSDAFIPPAVTPRKMLQAHAPDSEQANVPIEAPPKTSQRPKPRPRRPLNPVEEPPEPVSSEATANTMDSMYMTGSAPLFKRNWLSNSGSFAEEASTRHESMPYEASLPNEHTKVVHVGDCPEENAKPHQEVTPGRSSPSSSSNDTLYFTPNCSQTEETSDEWHYRLPSPPSAFRDTRSQSPAVSKARGDRPPPYSDEEIPCAVESDERRGLTGTAAVLSELSRVISEQRRDKVNRASTLDSRLDQRADSAGKMRLNNFSLSTYTRPQSAHAVISPEVKPSLVVARRSSFNNGLCAANGVSVRRTTSHATLSGLSAGQLAPGRDEVKLDRATSEMNLAAAGLPAALQLDPEQASLLDEFMEWRRQQRLKKQAQKNGMDGTDIKAKVLEDDVQSLQMFQRILNHIEATESAAPLSKESCIETGEHALLESSNKQGRAKPAEENCVEVAEEIPIKSEKDAEIKVEETRFKAAGDARVKAAEDARVKAADEAHVKAAEEARVKAAEEARVKAAEEARVKAAEDARVKAAEEARVKAAEEARVKAAEEARVKAAEEARVKAAEDARVKVVEDARDTASPSDNLKPETEEVVLRHKSDTAFVVPRARHVVSGPPTIEMSTWNERPKRQVSIKLDRDYWVGVGAAALRRTGGVDADKIPAPRPESSSALPSQKCDTSRIPIVRAVELKKTATTIRDTRPLNSVVYLSDDSSVKSVSVVGNKTKKFTSVVDINASSVNGNGVRVNGIVPHEDQAKKNLPMPVVKSLKPTRQLSAPNPTMPPPPPPPVPPTMPLLRKTLPRPQSTPAKVVDPRDQLLEAIRSFGGRTNLRPT